MSAEDEAFPFSRRRTTSAAMGPRSALGSHLLLLLAFCGISAGFVQENCTDFKVQFEKVFSVPGDVAMLNSSLVDPRLFNLTADPFNISWYNSRTGEEMSNRTGRTLVYGETLWILNVTLDSDGEYVAVVRTPSLCFMQAIRLVVDPPAECGRPQKAFQRLQSGASDTLHCPLKDFIDKLDSYNVSSSIRWYRGCDPIEDGTDGYIYRDDTKLAISSVGPQNNGLHTCTLTFTLGGVTGSVSETIEANVTDEHTLVPKVCEPAGETIKAPMGSNFSKKCLVFVPGVGVPFIDVLWFARGHLIIYTRPSDRIHTSERMWSQDGPKPGTWIEGMLTFAELKEEDFNVNYTCKVFSSRGLPEGYFTLLQPDPNIALPIGLVLGGAILLFIISVILLHIFKIDIVLWFRKAFPVLYRNKDLDGKLYDAYVAYPQPYDVGFSDEVETFALHTLPQVLEEACDYKLFIAGRDGLPGQATVDSVEENIQASRRLLLLYTASTFIRRRHACSTSSNNNNSIKSGDISHESNHKMSETGSETCDCSHQSYPDTRQQFECVAGMHRALMEGSLKVVLVELEEVSPDQLALFPESVRHLRKKQGAVCWWKNRRTRQRRRTCMRRTGDEGGKDSSRSPSLCPTSSFWKEMRYHMPARGKRAVYPERTALLSL